MIQGRENKKISLCLISKGRSRLQLKAHSTRTKFLNTGKAASAVTNLMTDIF